MSPEKQLQQRLSVASRAAVRAAQTLRQSAHTATDERFSHMSVEAMVTEVLLAQQDGMPMHRAHQALLPPQPASGAALGGSGYSLEKLATPSVTPTFPPGHGLFSNLGGSGSLLPSSENGHLELNPAAGPVGEPVDVLADYLVRNWFASIF